MLDWMGLRRRSTMTLRRKWYCTKSAAQDSQQECDDVDGTSKRVGRISRRGGIRNDVNRSGSKQHQQQQDQHQQDQHQQDQH
eukprot:3985635-Amphidinium_carterae.1